MIPEEDRDHVAIYTETVDSQSERAEELLLDPLPHLREKLQLEGDWAVTEGGPCRDRTCDLGIKSGRRGGGGYSEGLAEPHR